MNKFTNIILAERSKVSRICPVREYLITSIYPVRDGLALMVTNSFGGIAVDTWLVFERHMTLVFDRVNTRLSYVGEHASLSGACEIVRRWSLAVYGKDVIGDDLPF